MKTNKFKRLIISVISIVMIFSTMTSCGQDVNSDNSSTSASVADDNSSEKDTIAIDINVSRENGDSSGSTDSSENDSMATSTTKTSDSSETGDSSKTESTTKKTDDSSGGDTTSTKATADNTTKLTSKNTSQSTTKSTTKSTTTTTKATTKATTKQTTKSTTTTTKTGGITLVGTEVNYYNLFTGKGTQADINAIINELRNWVIKEYNGRKGTITYKSNYSSGTPTDSFTVNYPINLKVNTSFNIDNNALLNIGSTIIYYPPYLQKYVGEEELRKIAKEYREHGLQMMSTGIHADVNTNNRWQKRNEVLEFNVGIVPWEENGGTTYALWFLTPC